MLWFQHLVEMNICFDNAALKVHSVRVAFPTDLVNWAAKQYSYPVWMVDWLYPVYCISFLYYFKLQTDIVSLSFETILMNWEFKSSGKITWNSILFRTAEKSSQ